MERRIIMCRRHPVLAFDYDPSSGKAVGSGRILDCSRLPLELISHGKPAIYAKSIDAWWRRRAIPPTRDGIRGILDSMGIRSAVELLNRSHGLSLSDQYWVKPESSDLEWDTVNFFTNPFDEELGRTLLTARSSSHRFSRRRPSETMDHCGRRHQDTDQSRTYRTGTGQRTHRIGPLLQARHTSSQI